MSNFSLIKDLDTHKNKKVDKAVLGIRYQEYEVVVEGEDITIKIPLRETENFENYMEKSNFKKISGDDLRQILRYYRGTKVRDEE